MKYEYFDEGKQGVIRMKKIIFVFLLVGLILYTSFAFATNQQIGIIIYKEASVKSRPTYKAKTIANLNTGDEVTILGSTKNKYKKVKVDKMVGWISEWAIIDLSIPKADAKLFVQASNYQDPTWRWFFWSPERYKLALRLYKRLIDYFPNSKYRAAALFRYGECAERIVVEVNKLKIKFEELKKSGIDKDYKKYLGLDCYRKWGLEFEFSHLGDEYYYGGDVYETIVQKYPKSEWADNAAYKLIQIPFQHSRCWEGHPGGPLAALKLCENFLKNYPNSELRPEALLHLGYLYRALYEIYSYVDKKEIYNFYDLQKANAYRQKAINLYQKIVKEYPSTKYAAKAEVNIYEIEHGKNVYVLSGGK